MDMFLKAAAAVLLTVILILTLNSNNKQSALLLMLAVCAMLGWLAVSFFQPVLEFIDKLQTVGTLDDGMFLILIKAVGIGFVGELTCLICMDSGNKALGKGIQILSTAVILRLSLPLFDRLLKLLEQMLGEV